MSVSVANRDPPEEPQKNPGIKQGLLFSRSVRSVSLPCVPYGNTVYDESI